MLYGRARRHLSERSAFCVTFGAGTLSLLVIAFAPNYATVALGNALFGIAVAWIFPNLLIAVGQLAGGKETR